MSWIRMTISWIWTNRRSWIQKNLALTRKKLLKKIRRTEAAADEAEEPAEDTEE